MARPALVLDASVGVKWYSDKGESFIAQSLAIRDAHIHKMLLVIVPDLFYFEVANAVVQKKFIPVSDVQQAVKDLFDLGLYTESIQSKLLVNAVDLSRRFNTTTYDAIYAVIAALNNCPLVTANPRHQKQDLGCQVIPLDQWKM